MMATETVPIEIFGIAVEVPYPSPMGIREAGIAEYAAKLCDPVLGIGLRANQVRLRRFDELFDYELSAQFFGDNGAVTRSADRAKLVIRNARNFTDWNLIHQTLVRFYNLSEFPEESVTSLSCHVHAKFPSGDDRDGYLSQFQHSFQVLRPAGLGYARIADWEKDIRVLIEQSNVVPHAIFVAWESQFTNCQDWDSFLGTIPTFMENSANIFGLGFEPMAPA